MAGGLTGGVGVRVGVAEAVRVGLAEPVRLGEIEGLAVGVGDQVGVPVPDGMTVGVAVGVKVGSTSATESLESRLMTAPAFLMYPGPNRNPKSSEYTGDQIVPPSEEN